MMCCRSLCPTLVVAPCGSNLWESDRLTKCVLRSCKLQPTTWCSWGARWQGEHTVAMSRLPDFVPRACVSRKTCDFSGKLHFKPRGRT
eukprot:4189786-Amphidinium_carterae.1